MQELRYRNPSQQLYVRALSSAWRSGVQLHDPSVWLLKDPEAEEKMLRDGDIAHAVGYRRHLIAGRQWSLLPAIKGDPKSELAVHVGTRMLGDLKHFTGARLNLARAFFSGSRFARIHGEAVRKTFGDGQPRTWWVPTRLEDLDKRAFRIVPKLEDEKLSSHWEHWNIAKSAWEIESISASARCIKHIYQDDQGTLGHGRALREAVGWWWYAKEHVFAESMQAVERFAQGILTAKIDGARDASTGLPNQELLDEWRKVLEDMRSRHVLVMDSSDTLETIQPGGEGWNLLRDIRQELRTTIHTLILGANLTTSADKGGSYALAEVQENSTEALVQFDRETLEETLTDDLLGCLWRMNYPNLLELGISELKPRFNIDQEKRIDPVQRATVARELHGMGVPLSMEDIYEQTGFRKPDDGEDMLAGAVPALPAMGGGFPGLEGL